MPVPQGRYAQTPILQRERRRTPVVLTRCLFTTKLYIEDIVNITHYSGCCPSPCTQILRFRPRSYIGTRIPTQSISRSSSRKALGCPPTVSVTVPTEVSVCSVTPASDGGAPATPSCVSFQIVTLFLRSSASPGRGLGVRERRSGMPASDIASRLSLLSEFPPNSEVASRARGVLKFACSEQTREAHRSSSRSTPIPMVEVGESDL